MENDLFYRLALTFIPQIGPVQAKILIDKYGDAQSIFQAGQASLETTDGIGTIRAGVIRNFNNFQRVEKEIRFIEKFRVKPLFLTDPAYPKRLLNCYDPPTMLYYRGDANLNHPKTIAIVGTRLHSDYGKHLTEKLIADLASLDVLIVSGLAFGIDALAHKNALKNGMNTIGVLAHGLDTLYPPQHSALAREMLHHGGLLTEFSSHAKLNKHNFPARNRIVAGLCDATIIIETGIKGGSIITADLANSYNREVFAYPGKINDAKSAGCNQLIVSNKAILLQQTQQLITAMGWEKVVSKSTPPTDPPVASTPIEKTVLHILQHKPQAHVDEIAALSGLTGHALACVLLNLEIMELIVAAPGKMYKMANLSI